MISIREDGLEDPTRIDRGWVAVEASLMDLASYVCGPGAWSNIVWKGGRRLSQCFLKADYCALDIDGNAEASERSMEEAAEFLASKGVAFLIAPTKSSGIAKTVRERWTPPQDRYRIILPFTRPVTNAAEYNYSVDHYGRAFVSHDRGTRDGGRFWSPSKGVAFMSMGSALPPLAAPPPNPEEVARRAGEKEAARRRFERSRALPPDLQSFLERGRLLAATRHATIFLAGIRLAEIGVPLDLGLSFVLGAPFERGGTREVTDHEITRTVRDAYKTVLGVER